jgi:endonuclease/exonuclease/phosphatase (EEP) superfamily protein YafD
MLRLVQIFKALFIVFIFLAGTTSAAGIQGHDPDYEDCSFACKEIPLASEVLREFGQSKSNHLQSYRIKVLAWNIYKGRKENFLRDFSKLAAGKDIILFSEATTADPVLSAMSSRPGFGWDFATSFLMKKQVGTGTAVGSYARASGVGFYRTTDVEPFVKSPKTIVKAEYQLPNTDTKILVLSIHGINWSGDEALERQLQMTIPDLMKHQGPIVFAGDFNVKNSTRLQVIKNVLGQAGLERVKWLNPESGDQLNDAFTRGLTVHRAELINEVIDSGSDHPAIDLDLELTIK